MKLYDRLHEPRVPWFTGQRMRLPCLTFTLRPVSAIPSTLGRVFHAKADALGTVEIKTPEELSRSDSLTLVHPWVDFLLDRRPIGGITNLILEEEARHQSSPITSPSSSSATSNVAPSSSQRRASMMERIRRFGSFNTPSRDTSSTDKRIQALQLIARLRQPFGALLFKQTRHNVAEYKRVAAESNITVRIKDETSLEMLIDSVQILDVL
ncbi:hypothetical protein JVT61DRAFT_3384 [Boletus reticuloceps]|uniref:Uncharacterized protein n=1 Tax=Boletus reticuloceps TaxID=495285 RepID=A0A8I2YND6_9AGAM|nr:hypothetical protein JVT61DRAFT_3384 [Boletus reticuloceps]